MMAVHNQRDTEKNWVYETQSFDLVKVRYPSIFILLPGLKTGARFAFSCIAFIVYIYRPIFGLFLLRQIIFIDRNL